MSPAAAQSLATVERNGGLVSLEACGPNIVHVTIALDKKEVDQGSGYGIIARPDTAGWTRRGDAARDVFTSSALQVTLDAQPWPKSPTQMERHFVP
ncbi:hypothetical protein AB2M62_04445 [Sphingomonas sp. MMS12-HWE2-04]|uniref:hypothetical protein n=1 Tax=Sphingomonas sp. MMS12-HWE2-04 TaxID=3234199 RepID=UPI00384E3905